MSSVLSDRHFHDEATAYRFVEARVWPQGPVCPHCGTVERIGKLEGKSTRVGVYKCYGCRKPFTVKVGTIFESSHVALHLWLQAIFLMASSKKGISANQLHRTLGVSLKTAWFMSHRIREAMRSGNLAPMGGNGAGVEVDETYFGNKDEVTTRTKFGKPGLASKRAVLALVERGGMVRSFFVERADRETVEQIVTDNIVMESTLYTDESRLYTRIGASFGGHESVRHSADEYVRGAAHTNTVEGFFSVFKRGMRGTYQHCAEKHLHRYLAEFDFRYNHRVANGVTDVARAAFILDGVVGRRLTYQTTGAK